MLSFRRPSTRHELPSCCTIICLISSGTPSIFLSACLPALSSWLSACVSVPDRLSICLAALPSTLSCRLPVILSACLPTVSHPSPHSLSQEYFYWQNSKRPDREKIHFGINLWFNHSQNNMVTAAYNFTRRLIHSISESTCETVQRLKLCNMWCESVQRLKLCNMRNCATFKTVQHVKLCNV